ncbi:MAG: hypothetical protein R3E77_10170 [Steroidobacteraceae bacterium]
MKGAISRRRNANSVPAGCGSAGQALVYLLGMLGALLAGVVVTFNATQLLARKQRLLNAADAAAFSVATWQARMLNSGAYVNRAIVANEAAIAQAVSLRSWLEYMQTATRNSGAITSAIPYVGQAMAALARLAGGINATAQPALGATEIVLSTSNQELALAQRAFLRLGALTTPDLARRALNVNEPTASWSAGGELALRRQQAQWQGFLVEDGGRRRERLKNVVGESLDEFTRARSYDVRPPLLGAVLRLRKRGGTELLGFDTWRGMDTAALHARPLFGGFRETIPLGWGSAENGRATLVRGWHDGSWAVNPRTSSLARAGTVARRQYLGLPSSLALRDRAAGSDPRLRTVLRAQLPRQSLEFWQEIWPGARLSTPGTSDADAEPSLLRDRILATSAAEVAFVRPIGRRDRQRERGSLFNPYWRARLASLTTGEQALLDGADAIAGARGASP